VVATPAAPVVEAPRPKYKDEGRDVLGDALRSADQAIDGYTGKPCEPVDVSAPADAPVPTPEVVVPPVAEVAAPVLVTPPAEPVPEKLYAGKFKTVEEMEAAYKASEKMAHTKAQEAAAAKQAAEAGKTPEQIAKDEADRKAALINEFLEDPEKVISKVQSQAEAKLQEIAAVNATVENWKKANPDIAQYEFFVGAEMQRLILSNPELISDKAALLTQATTNFRQAYGAIREEGKKEALAVQSSVTPLGSSKVQVAPPTEQPAKGSMTQEAALDSHMQFLRDQAARVRRGR
jgi:hypothetical protein